MNIDAISGMGRYYAALPRAANFVLVVLIGITLARLTWLVVPAPTGAPGAAPAATAAAGASDAPGTERQSLVAAITGAHLFHKAVTAVHAAPIDAPETHLNLTLTGVLFSQAPHGSVAIIRDDKGQERYYRPGDEVVSGVTLDAIHTDRVILRRAGRYETLSLSVEQAAQRMAANARKNGGDAPDLAQVRKKLLQKPGSITQFLRLMPVYSNGGLRGYRVYPGTQRALFMSTGLHPGDLVTAINGISLRDPGKSAAALSELSKASSVNVTLTRLGQTQNLTISLQ